MQSVKHGPKVTKRTLQTFLISQIARLMYNNTVFAETLKTSKSSASIVSAGKHFIICSACCEKLGFEDVFG